MDSTRTQFEITPNAGTAREIVVFAAPLMIAHLSQSMMWVVDTFLMGWVGNAEQGAVGLGGVLYWTATCFFAGTLTVINILVAQDFGAGRTGLSRHVRTGLALVLPMTLIILALTPFVPEALRLMNVTEQARPHAQSYLQIRLLGAPLLLTSFVLTSFLRGIGDTVTPMVVVIAANVFNAIVSAILVFGFLGLPAMGVAGAAWGSVAAAGLEAALYGVVYLFRKPSRAQGWRTPALPKRQDLVEFLTLGTPIGTAWLFEMVAWTAFSIYAGTRPPQELAAHTVLFQVTSFCFMPAMAIGIAASTLVGQYLGAERADLAKRTGTKAVCLGVCYMVIVGSALALFREPLMLSFNKDESVIALGSTLAIIAAIYQPFDGFSIVAQGVLRGAKQTAVPTFIMLGSGLLVFIPLVWYLGSKQGMGVKGAWIAAVVHVVLVAILVGIAVMRSRACTKAESRPVASAA